MKRPRLRHNSRHIIGHGRDGFPTYPGGISAVWQLAPRLRHHMSLQCGLRKPVTNRCATEPHRTAVSVRKRQISSVKVELYIVDLTIKIEPFAICATDTSARICVHSVMKRFLALAQVFVIQRPRRYKLEQEVHACVVHLCLDDCHCLLRNCQG